MSQSKRDATDVIDVPAPSERARLLGHLALFRAMPPDQLALFADKAKQRAMRVGEVLFRRGEAGTTMLVILAGQVRIALPSREGREQVLRVLQPGDVVGEMALLDGGDRTADAVAETNGRLLVIERRDLIEALRTSPELCLAVVATLSERLRRTNALLESMLFQDAAGRLASALLTLTDGQKTRRLDITQGALGERIGAARETVNKRLREWQASGVIALEPGRVTVLDLPALTRLASPAGSLQGEPSHLW